MRHRRLMEMVALATGLASLSIAQLSAADGSQPSSPPYSPIGLLIMWWICARRRKEEIGGWLLCYYFQLYFGCLVAVLIALMSFSNYLPSTWEANPTEYPLFLLSTLPGLVILPVQVFVAERLRRSRDARFVSRLLTNSRLA